MKELVEYRENLLKRFEDIVEDLRQTVAAIPPECLYEPCGAAGLSPHQTLTHLCGIEGHALSLRLRQILDTDNPIFELFSDQKWLRTNHDPEQGMDELVDAYARLRQKEMEWIRTMPPEGWNRTARHPWFGMRTFQWWVERCLAYGEEHLADLKIVSAG